MILSNNKARLPLNKGRCTRQRHFCHLPIEGIFFSAFLLLSFGHAQAQRIAQPLGRGVVATSRSGSVTITWRRLAQDPESARYNVYTVTGSDGHYVRDRKLNASPLQVSNYKSTLVNGEKVAVCLVDAEGNEGSLSAPFVYRKPEFDNLFLDINFRKAGSPLPDNGDYGMKFCWPVDLTGDGEYDYVVDRPHNGFAWTNRDSRTSDCLEAYTHDGRHLWTICLGPNIFLSKGQNDGVTVGDFDCDGYAEVMVQVSDSCRLWDSEAKTWGRWLAAGISDGSVPDTDGDGILNYTGATQKRNPQYYMLVLDGRTGAQKAVVAQTLPKDRDSEYTRTNKQSWMADEYSYMCGAMGTAYLDGLHPSAVCQFQLRNTAAHHYYTYAYGYDFSSSVPQFKELFTYSFHDGGNPSEFHHLRQGDVDGDGCDETLNGAFALDHDGRMLWNSGVAHGDRFRLSDIDPELPGQEVFAIQQNAPDMLGQVLYSAVDGSSLRRWYLNGVGDVGRGECMDILKEHRGYEMWSTMPNLYAASGAKVISGTYKDGGFPYPTEGLWWDGDLDREYVNAPDAKVNLDVRKFNYSSSGTRLVEMAKESGYRCKGESGIRPMFWGDIIGDWREELLLKRTEGDVVVGLVGYTTNHTSSVRNIYCLQQDPGYRGQCTNRGYYQSPCTSFYLGYDMPSPPLPPFMTASAVWKEQGKVWGEGSTDFTDMHRMNDVCYHDGGSVMFALDGAPNVEVMGNVAPDTTFLMIPSGHDYTFSGSGAIAGGEIWKSGEGRAVLNVDLTTPLTTYVSEGVLELNGVMSGPLSLRARGTLAGNAHLLGGVELEGALNHEGCRLMPSPQGCILVDGALVVDHRLFVELSSLSSSKAPVQVAGRAVVTDSLVFTIPQNPVAGDYVLLLSSDLSALNLKKIGIRGNALMQYSLQVREASGVIPSSQELVLRVEGYLDKEQRKDPALVTWTGVSGDIWDFETENFILADGRATNYVDGDTVLFPGGVLNSGVRLLAEVHPRQVIVDNDVSTLYSLLGEGRIAGDCQLIKRGAGQLSVSTTGANTYTGGTILYDGILAQGTSRATFGALGSTIVAHGGTLQQFYTTSSSDAPVFDYVLSLPESTDVLTLVESGRTSLSGSVTGWGALTLYNNYVRADNGLDYSGFEGDLILTGPKDYMEHRFVKPTVECRQGRLIIEAGASAQGYKAGGKNLQNNVWHVGSLGGTGILGSGTWYVGYDDSDFTLSQRLSSGASVRKVGNGVMSVSEGRISVRCSASGCESPVLTASASADGVVVVAITNTGKAFEAGDSLMVFGSTPRWRVTGNVKVECALPAGLSWDVSTFTSDGVLRVVDVLNSLSLPTMSSSSSSCVYDLSGRVLESVPTKQFFIQKRKKMKR